MPRNLKLTWVAGAEGSGRAGRWRKKYKGKFYYFPGGRGKSDRDAYEAAVAAWGAEKAKIDRGMVRPHQRENEAALAEWEQVLAWSHRHGVHEFTEIAAKKVEKLRKRLSAPVLRPLSRDDKFESMFDNSEFAPRFAAIAAALQSQEQAKLAPRERIESFFGPADNRTAAVDDTIETLMQVDSQMAKILSKMPPGPKTRVRPIDPDWDIDPQRIQKEIWRDRLAVQARCIPPKHDGVEAYIKQFLDQKEHLAKAGQITEGRVYALRLHLEYFRDWCGKDTAIKEIDGQMLARYHAHLLEKITARNWCERTAGHYLTSVKGFVHWLWQIEAIAALPRVMDSRSKCLAIMKPASKIVIFTKEEIRVLLSDASDRTKLYILLMLNCGMTQKDISDLLVTEVDWEEGRIIRKRSKTSREENVPIVNYKLWPETFRLLRQERDATSNDRVLVNSNGGPLWSEEITEDGKYKKTDNVKNAFDRLRKVKKKKDSSATRRNASAKKAEKAVTATIDKPLKSLKKTSSTLLRDNERFSSLASLFLGHAPQSMSDRHYTQVPQTLLDQAMNWLESEYGLTDSGT